MFRDWIVFTPRLHLISADIFINFPCRIKQKRRITLVYRVTIGIHRIHNLRLQMSTSQSNGINIHLNLISNLIINPNHRLKRWVLKIIVIVSNLRLYITDISSVNISSFIVWIRVLPIHSLFGRTDVAM